VYDLIHRRLIGKGIEPVVERTIEDGSRSWVRSGDEAEEDRHGMAEGMAGGLSRDRLVFLRRVPDDRSPDFARLYYLRDVRS
jgi:hypothetical protein